MHLNLDIFYGTEEEVLAISNGCPPILCGVAEHVVSARSVAGQLFAPA
jgi:hypothetical protein